MPAVDRGRRKIEDYSPDELEVIARADAAQLLQLNDRVSRLLKDLEAQKALFYRKKDAPLSADERDMALDLFGQALSYQVTLDTIARFNLEFYRLLSPMGQTRHFVLGFTAYSMQVRLGFDFIDRTVGQQVFERLLDEGSPELGIPPRAYERLKWNVVHVQELGRIFAAHQYHKLLALTFYKKLEAPFAGLIPIADAHYAVAKKHLDDSGVKMFSANGLDLLKDGGHVAWFPVQASVAEVMGDTRVHRVHEDLIDSLQIEEAVKKSQPGDVIVERRNWYLSNVGLPGFWPHAALYLGTPVELAAFIDADPEVTAAYGGPFTLALAKKHARAWDSYQALEHEHPMRLIEAMSEGVVFTTAEHSFAADYAADLRPRLSKLEIARAIERAFGYAGRPYDFDFDFQTDRSLVCSELVYKAYEPRKGIKGLAFALERVVGRPTLPPNTMIAQFDREAGTPEQQLDFAWFLDGREKARRAEWAGVEVLRASHRRPKWDIVQQ